VLVVEEVADPEPAAVQVLVDVRVSDVVYGDVIVRSGRHPLPLPSTPGVEVGGRAVAVGPDVDDSLPGRTVVATTAGQAGGYAERALIAMDLRPLTLMIGQPAHPNWICHRPA
jgi:NADPH2:quinone reductase